MQVLHGYCRGCYYRFGLPKCTHTPHASSTLLGNYSFPVISSPWCHRMGKKKVSPTRDWIIAIFPVWSPTQWLPLLIFPDRSFFKHYMWFLRRLLQESYTERIYIEIGGRHWTNTENKLVILLSTCTIPRSYFQTMM